MSAAPPAGHSQPAGQPAPASQNQAASGGTGMEENVASLLCYVLWWVTGIIFLIIDKRAKVRFHAAQSIVVFVGISVILWILREIFYTNIVLGGFGMGWTLGYAVYSLVELAAVILWILLMVKAYQGQTFRVPIAADLADSLAGKVKV
jgi:uncharacterized membrane protein